MAPLSQSGRVRNFCHFLSYFAMMNGMNTFFRPEKSYNEFGFNTVVRYPSEGAYTRKIFDALMYTYGVRQLFVGYGLILCATSKDNKIADDVKAAVMLGWAAITAADGFICWWVGVYGAWLYLPWILMRVLLGLVYLKKFDGKVEEGDGRDVEKGKEEVINNEVNRETEVSKGEAGKASCG